MHTDYESRYLDAVRSMVDGGMEVRLMDGRALRERMGADSDLAMSREFSEEIRTLCRSSLALDEHSADKLRRLFEGKSVKSPAPKSHV